MGRTDHSTFAFGQDFFGYIAGGYGAQVVRLVDVPFSQSELEVRASKEGFAVAVIRAEDSTDVNFSKDLSYSATEVNSISLPLLPSNGDTIYGLGGNDTIEGGAGNDILKGSGGQQDNFDIMRWRRPHFLQGAGQKVHLKTIAGGQLNYYELDFQEPWFMGRKLKFSTSIYSREMEYFHDKFDVEETGIRIGLERAFFGDENFYE